MCGGATPPSHMPLLLSVRLRGSSGRVRHGSAAAGVHDRNTRFPNLRHSDNVGGDGGDGEATGGGSGNNKKVLERKLKSGKVNATRDHRVETTRVEGALGAKDAEEAAFACEMVLCCR